METLITVLLVLALVAPTITAIASLIVALGTSKAIHNVHLDINSRFDQWIQATKKASFAEGHLAGQEEKK